MNADSIDLEVSTQAGSTRKKITLLFDHYFESGQGKYDILHLIRSRGHFLVTDWKEFEERYWSSLDRNRNGFADGVGTDYDLIVDAPSNSGHHRPFLSAVRQRCRCPFAVLVKETHFRAEPGNLDKLRAAIKFHGKVAGNIGDRRSVLIVDDVYCSGTIARIVIEKLLEAGLSPDANIVVACPLRMPPKPEASDVMAAVSDQGADGG